ncbi:tyrosine-type recombinase/integrase [Lachnoclostridium phytofermentans]|uniref:Integrase family protein n=1 Tax=Lachnoclostridium phytofermentans (strain ATCC 700394 / DSM 18823 / ISDg) TaxID=357809 RepID=A9KJ56_LACP7|nr:tyrosine-type recombinase/integrase [Lachnoclostridium phytofermentans]ABX42468.1 integrase family protein [Lachnoclostridium phytofermentans ISDg]
MANKKTLALTREQYILIIQTIKEGFIREDGSVFKPNERLATILTLEANLGIRISDILQLKLTSIVKDGDRYRLDIIEQKTGKKREFTVMLEIYTFIQEYALNFGISPRAKLFDISERAVQKQLKIAADHLGLQGISTHSFRKFFATEIYLNNNANIELVRILLQQSSSTTTQRYIGIQRQDIEQALANHICLV